MRLPPSQASDQEEGVEGRSLSLSLEGAEVPAATVPLFPTGEEG